MYNTSDIISNVNTNTVVKVYRQINNKLKLTNAFNSSLGGEGKINTDKTDIGYGKYYNCSQINPFLHILRIRR